jgi:hypothetical protein
MAVSGILDIANVQREAPTLRWPGSTTLRTEGYTPSNRLIIQGPLGFPIG